MLLAGSDMCYRGGAMASIPLQAAELLERGARRRADRRRRDRPTGDLPAHPAVGRRAHVHDVVHPVQPEARAHRAATPGSRSRSPTRSRRRSDRPRHDPGRRPGHRRRPARRLGTAAADLGGEGAGDRGRSSRLASRCRCSSSGRSSRSRRAGSCTGRTATPRRAAGHRRRRRGGRVMRSTPVARRARTASRSSRRYPFHIPPGSTTRGYPVQRRRRGRRSTRAAGRPRSRAPAGLAVPTDATSR